MQRELPYGEWTHEFAQVTGPASCELLSRPWRHYRLQVGRAVCTVPGVTSITGRTKGVSLLNWAGREGGRAVLDHGDLGSILCLTGAEREAWLRNVAGNAHNEVRDRAGNIGTQVHNLIENYHRTGAEPDLQTLEPEVRRGWKAFLAWREMCPYQVEHLERVVFSVQHGYAGKVDNLSLVDGKRYLIDYKTGGVWSEALCQMGAYALAALENGLPVEGAILVGLDKRTGRVTPYHLTSLDLQMASYSFLAELAATRLAKPLDDRLAQLYAQAQANGRKGALV